MSSVYLHEMTGKEWPLVNYVLFIIVITVFNILNRYPDWQFFSIIHVTRNIIDAWFLGRHDSEFQNLPRKSVLDCHWWGTYIGILVRIWQMMYNYMYVWIMKIVFSIVHSILFYWRGDTFRPTFARLGELRSISRMYRFWCWQQLVHHKFWNM